MKNLWKILTALLAVTLLIGIGVAAAEINGPFQFSIEQETLEGEQTVIKEFTLAHTAAVLNVTVKITSNITGEETDVDIYRLKYEVRNPANKRIGKQVALDALEGKYTSTQTFNNIDAGDVKVKIKTNSAAANLIYTITVNGEYKIALNKTKAVLKKGKKLTLKSEYAGGLTKAWSSSNINVATVDSNGVVTAVGAGNATITLHTGNQSVSCEVTVYGIEALSNTLYTKESYRLKLLGKGKGDTVVWSSANPSIAKVNSKGKVTGVSAGKTVITATVTSAINGKTYVCTRKITVKKNPFPKLMKVIGGKLALRKTPSTQGVLIKYYDINTVVTVKSIENGWAYVTVGGQKGYMMVQYLKEIK